MERIIFLDVDGVLNNGSWAMEMYDKGIRVYRDGILYEPALERLKRIVDATNAHIVVSSSWRQIPTAYGHLKDWLEKYGMTIWDKTPYVGGCRGDDITAYVLEEMKGYFSLIEFAIYCRPRETANYDAFRRTLA